MRGSLLFNILAKILGAKQVYDTRGIPGAGQDITSMGYNSGNFKQNQRKQRKLSRKRKMKRRK